MSSSSVRDQNSIIGSPKGQLLNGLNIPKNGLNLSLATKNILSGTDEDNSRVNLLALLKQLNQRKSSEEANLSIINSLAAKTDRKTSLWRNNQYHYDTKPNNIKLTISNLINSNINNYFDYYLVHIIYSNIFYYFHIFFIFLKDCQCKINFN